MATAWLIELEIVVEDDTVAHFGPPDVWPWHRVVQLKGTEIVEITELSEPETVAPLRPRPR